MGGVPLLERCWTYFDFIHGCFQYHAGMILASLKQQGNFENIFLSDNKARDISEIIVSVCGGSEKIRMSQKSVNSGPVHVF